jgi:hypothetical protein
METKNNTEKVSIESGWKLLADICHKADKNELLRRALKKVANMNKKDLMVFLGEKQKQFGRLLRIVSDISLEATGSFKISSFLKIKKQSGIFAYVDGDIFNWFDDEVKNSPAKELASYEFTENITEENIVGDAKTGGIYEEVDFAHIKQICERHIVKGEKLLKENGFANLFWIRNKKGALCDVNVRLCDGGWYVSVRGFDPSLGWDAGYQSFFRN